MLKRNSIRFTTYLLISSLLISCAITPPIQNQYQLTQYRFIAPISYQHPLPTLYISTPEAVPGLQTTQMLYTKMPFTTKTYVHNIWDSPPADMLYPLIIQSLQHTKAFEIVSSGSHAENYQYQLDTQLLYFVQNFQKKPAHMDMIIKATVTHSPSEKMLASRLFHYTMPCPQDSPYGGVIAANRITQQWTYDLSRFTVNIIAAQHKKKSLH